MKKILILGATGLVGQNLVRICCASESTELVKVFIRKKLTSEDQVKLFGTSEKLEVHTIDFDFLSQSTDSIKGDVLLSALGTTIKKAKSKKNFFHVDHDYNISFAQQAHNNGVPVMGIVSSVGAQPTSSSFYLKTKGIIEQDLVAMNFQKFIAVRPSFLIGDRGYNRMGEKIGVRVFKSLKPVMLGGLKKYVPIAAWDVAKILFDLCLEDDELKTPLEYFRQIRS